MNSTTERDANPGAEPVFFSTPMKAAGLAAISVVIVVAWLAFTARPGDVAAHDVSLVAHPEGLTSVVLDGRALPHDEMPSLLSRGIVGTFPRVGLRFPVSGQARYDLHLAAPAVLDFALGLTAEDGALPPAPVHASVDLLSGDGPPRRLFEQQLDAPEAQWREVRLPLEGMAGRDVSLVFSATMTHDPARAEIAAVFASPAVRYQRRPPPRNRIRNIVFIVVDSLAYDTLGFHGHPRVRTPAIDRLFTEHAVAFDNFRTAAPWTIASFCAMLTGAHPCFSGEVEDQKALMVRRMDMRTLPERLRETGYATMAATSNDIMGPSRRLDLGFDVYNFQRTYPAQRLAAPMCDFLRGHRRSPFFVMAHFNDPHMPYGDRNNHPVHGWDRLEQEPFMHLYYPHGLHGQADVIRSATFTPEEIDQIKLMYEDDVALADEGVALLMRCLEDERLLDSTLVVFTADHGEEFWEHDSFEHGHTCYDELVRCALAFAHPSFTARRSDTPIAGVDLAPTILELLGVDPGEMAGQFQGQSYADYIRGGPPPVPPRLTLNAEMVEHNQLRYEVDRRAVAWLWERADIPEGIDYVIDDKLQASMALIHYPELEEIKSVVRDDGATRFKYILNCKTYEEELYDLLADPGERRNLLLSNEQNDPADWELPLQRGRAALLAILTARVDASPRQHVVTDVRPSVGRSLEGNPYGR